MGLMRIGKDVKSHRRIVHGVLVSERKIPLSVLEMVNGQTKIHLTDIVRTCMIRPNCSIIDPVYIHLSPFVVSNMRKAVKA